MGTSLIGGNGGTPYATEWSGGSVINLGALFGGTYIAYAINDAGQAVGSSLAGAYYATEWSNGTVSNLGGLPGSTDSFAQAINDAGQVVGYSVVGGRRVAALWTPSNPSAVPEPSTWAMMLIGFAGLGFAGYRRATLAT